MYTCSVRSGVGLYMFLDLCPCLAGAMDLGHMNVVLKWMYLYVGSVFRMWNVVLK